MAFNPLKEKGIPIEKQFKSWDELNVAPYDKDEVHPYTRTRIILMNGIEVDGSAPSQSVIEQHIDRHGQDYRLETEGPHPVERLRAREMVNA